MAAQTEKIAVTVDREVLARIERLRRRTGESRSALVTRALAQLAATAEHLERVKRYCEAYREQPESISDIDAARAQARLTMSGLPWEEP